MEKGAVVAVSSFGVPRLSGRSGSRHGLLDEMWHENVLRIFVCRGRASSRVSCGRILCHVHW